MYLWPSASTMGKSFEKEHKKVWAVNARLACEAKKAEAPLDPTSMDPAPSSAGDNTPVEPIKPKAHSWEPHVPTTRWNPPHLQSSSATLSSVPQNVLGVPTTTNSTAVVEACPVHETTLTAHTLFQEIQQMDDKSEECNTETDDGSSDDLSWFPVGLKWGVA